jgi:hypothetical protein
VTTFNLSAIMDAIATAIPAGVTDRVFAYPVRQFTPPCAIVGFPKPGSIDFDLTFKRGADAATFPLWFMVGTGDDLAARDQLSDIIDGAVAIKSAIESDAALAAAVSTVTVTDCGIELLAQADNSTYWAAAFTVEVTT